MDALLQEIQDQFSKSWITTQAQFAALIDEPEHSDIIPLFIFIQQFKKSGDYQNFRSGISRQDLIISRSAEPALRPGQKFIRMRVTGSTFIVTLKDSKKMYREYTLKDLDDERFEELLQTLKDIPVD